MIHHRIENTKDITGISLTAGRKGEKVKVALKAFITSNEKIFYTGIRGIYGIFLQPFIQLEKCNQFLILRHKDKSADIYINDFALVLMSFASVLEPEKLNSFSRSRYIFLRLSYCTLL